MKKLIKGLHKFQTEVFPIKQNFFQELVKEQNPEVLFITCSDSRINPNLVTSAEPGDLFILRNAGNIIPIACNSGSEEATIEFAISQLNIKDIILCGHSHCGAIKAVIELNKIQKYPSLYNWIKTNIEPTLELIKKNYSNLDQESLLSILTQEHVLKQLENLKTYKSVEQAIRSSQIVLHAWIYQFETGTIFSYDSAEGQFKTIRSLLE